jgi:hypothetical protein
MAFALETIAQKNDKQPVSRDTTKYVRRNWSVFVAYYLGTSIAVGFGVAAAMLIFAVPDFSKHGNQKPMPVHGSLIFSMAVLGVVATIGFVIQLVAGPFVFTKDVVCKKCRARQQVNRIAFFTGKYSRPPRCQCGGKIEPAFLWKPDTAGLDSPDARRKMAFMPHPATDCSGGKTKCSREPGW